MQFLRDLYDNGVATVVSRFQQCFKFYEKIKHQINEANFNIGKSDMSCLELFEFTAKSESTNAEKYNYFREVLVLTWKI